ncbi:uncharacterized protein LOC110988361 isoform X2 [Acanthaster planci]|nr:uncharacterized protein LOC110988361 isoform X2 [Acanthaster planci]XP_022107469.1 uncharacterized protein LOC110988361 isoform X2 [Acanthaster planci]
MRSEREEDDGARSGRCVDSITGQSRIRCRRKSSSNEDLDDSDPDSDEEQEQWMEKPEAGVKSDHSVVGPLPLGSSSRISALVEQCDSIVVGLLPVGSSSDITALIE